jgi:hypothetical protein
MGFEMRHESGSWTKCIDRLLSQTNGSKNAAMLRKYTIKKPPPATDHRFYLLNRMQCDRLRFRHALCPFRGFGCRCVSNQPTSSPVIKNPLRVNLELRNS